MKIAILGASSEIAKDLIRLFAANNEDSLILFARRPDEMDAWLCSLGLSKKYPTFHFESFSQSQNLDAVINFVGVGDPSKAIEIGNSILGITEKYDHLALEYLKKNPKCKYIFMSSGAVYGESFIKPVGELASDVVSESQRGLVNHYALSKIDAELRHRNLPDLGIADLRIFSYFSHTQKIESHFFMSDVMRSIINKSLLLTSSEDMIRDYLGRFDFYQLIRKILLGPSVNMAVDCYSQSPVSKFELLKNLENIFGLQYQVIDSLGGASPTGKKKNYYSLNRSAEYFGYKPLSNSMSTVLSEVELAQVDLHRQPSP